ncbi:MAG: hypothetical protein V9E98_03245 [Candidatus Nanopelagicales bacterium]
MRKVSFNPSDPAELQRAAAILLANALALYPVGRKKRQPVSGATVVGTT